MGVHTFSTRGSDTTVRAPEPGQVMAGNSAGAWEAKSLDDAGAFPLLSAVQHQINDLVARITALEASQTARAMAQTGKK